MANSKRLREAIHHTLQQTENDLEAQHTATDYATRKRIHEFERAIDELNWQKQQVGFIKYDYMFSRTFKIEPITFSITNRRVIEFFVFFYRLKRRLLS